MILSGVNDLPKVVELKFDHVFFSGNAKLQTSLIVYCIVLQLLRFSVNL